MQKIDRWGRAWESESMTSKTEELLAWLGIGDVRTVRKLQRDQRLREILRQRIGTPDDLASFLERYAEVSPGAAIALARRLQEHHDGRVKRDLSVKDMKPYSLRALFYLFFESNSTIAGEVRGIGEVGVGHADDALTEILFSRQVIDILLEARDSKRRQQKKSKRKA